MQKKSTITLLSITPFVWLATTAPAHAYLDPGTATMLFQGLLAAVAAALGFARVYWHKLKTMTFFWKPTEAASDDAVVNEKSNPEQNNADAA